MTKFDLKDWLKNRENLVWRDIAINLILQSYAIKRAL